MPAAGQGTRLGLGPKAFVLLGERTLLERAVTTMLAVAARVIVAVPETEVLRARQLVSSARVSVIAGGDRRATTLRLLVDAARAPRLILHDIVHPLASVALAQRVIEAARRTGAAAPALPNGDFLHASDGTLRARPNELFAIQKPIVFPREAAMRGFDVADRRDGLTDPSVLEVLALAGQATAFVPGEAMNAKLTTRDDHAVLQALAAVEPSLR